MCGEINVMTVLFRKRLDRALAINEWVQCYQQAIVKHVVLEGSDHAMLVLSTDVDIPGQ